MAQRYVLFRIGNRHFSVPFEAVDEILSLDRILLAEDLPPEASSEAKAESLWVATRGRFVPISLALPPTEPNERSQIIVVRYGGKGMAFITDHVAAIEKVPERIPFPASAAACCDVPYAGVHIWNSRVVLELDLSRMISLQ